VAIVQITVTRVVFKHVAQRYVTHVMLRTHTSNVVRYVRCQTALGASRARRLIDGSGAKHSRCHIGIRRHMVDCITLRYVTLACLILRQTAKTGHDVTR